MDYHYSLTILININDKILLLTIVSLTMAMVTVVQGSVGEVNFELAHLVSTCTWESIVLLAEANLENSQSYRYTAYSKLFPFTLGYALYTQPCTFFFLFSCLLLKT